jgi:hypothetical protein
MELSVHTDKIINTVERLKSAEASRASDVGEDREAIKELLELTGLNKTAFAWIRRLDKLEPDKRADVMRSFGALMSLFEGKWGAQSTPDMFADLPEADEDGSNDFAEHDPAPLAVE